MMLYYIGEANKISESAKPARTTLLKRPRLRFGSAEPRTEIRRKRHGNNVGRHSPRGYGRRIVECVQKVNISQLFGVLFDVDRRNRPNGNHGNNSALRKPVGPVCQGHSTYGPGPRCPVGVSGSVARGRRGAGPGTSVGDGRDSKPDRAGGRMADRRNSSRRANWLGIANPWKRNR